ncbi:MAG TPA: serine/threonine-protein kinase [Gemmataceae bacterium]|jgi:serine/threonine protein kinase/tetratricopeptide (TPR) repeat protein|nr:serine/threonine-protein kinase [Gemmataceae bacterium]
MDEQSLFIAAAEIADPAERAKYLDRVCGVDKPLLQRVQNLLDRASNAGSFLEKPAVGHDVTSEFQSEIARPAAVASAKAIEQPGVMIDSYKLIEQIGEGGMGAVWMAQQTDPVKRLVALKLVKAGMDSKSVIARFEAERQALALMDHPNIARVLDGGTTPAGRPYFVMDLVKGLPITKFCDKHRFTPLQRLELFIAVCQAVQHAHQKGIIHRDLKPSNVLVALYDDKPVPKVIDFGLAKATGQQLTDKTLVTGFGAIVGTLEYMSPEQAEFNQLDIDTRSDIYSLGVLLYELLAGSPPFAKGDLEKAGMLEMLRVIREKEPSKPSTKLSTAERLPTLAANRGTEPAKLTKLIRGELDWIVMKALEKDRGRRYETAGGLAEDVHRYMLHEPVHAHPASAAYRLRKFARRHKGPVLAASLLLLVLVVGVVGTTAGFVRAEHQRQIAEQNETKAIAAAAAEKQERQLAQAREAEALALFQFVDEKIIAAARPEGQAGGLGREVTIRKALEVALPEIGPRFANQPLVEARLRFTVGTSFANLGERKIATDQIERSLALRRKHLASDHPDTLACMNNLANCYYAMGRVADATKLQEETLALMKARLGPEDPLTLGAISNLAISYATVGELEKALKLNEETVAIKKSKFGPDDPRTLGTMNNLAGDYRNLGRLDDALKLSTETVERSQKRLGLRNRVTLVCMDTLASIHYTRGEFAEAVKIYDSILPLMKEILGPGHSVTLTNMTALANTYAALGRYGDELKIREETIAKRPKADSDRPDALDDLIQLAELLAVCPDAKIRDPKRAVELATKAVERAPKSEWYLRGLGWAQFRAGAWQDSITALNKSIELRKSGGDSFYWFVLAMDYWHLGDKAAARKRYDQAVEWMAKNKPSDLRVHRFRAEADELMNKKSK